MWLTAEFAEVMSQLWKLRRDNHQMLSALAQDGPVVNRTVAWIVRELTLELIDAAPVLTGTLASAHRGVAEGHEGLLFIDQNVQNPVFGGFPAFYGEEVHEIGAFGGWAHQIPGGAKRLKTEATRFLPKAC
ncbi:MAG: hypothetical protein IPM39_24900 [Chloroflexi bacterium]|nr:hypothetical protein [Chloroflexota bacterium]